MSETDTIPVSASVASTGQSIMYLGNYAWCYTGGIGVINSATTVLETQTGSGLLVADVLLNYIFVGANDQMEWQVYLNDVLMAGAKDSGPAVYTEFNNPIKLILPPFTKLKVTAKNASSATSRAMGVILTGRVYGVA